MNITDAPLPGLKILSCAVHTDARGFFSERFHAKRFAEAGLPHIFLQDNHSRSLPGVLRGLHYQYGPPQAKLIGVIRGRIWDVAVDIRPGSPTLGKHFATEMNGEDGRLLWMPAGFAHGFCVLGGDPADLFYKVTSVYNAGGEGGIRFDDVDLGIKWPLEKPTVSERDRRQRSFAEYRASPPDWPL